jgi:hypothetical protein
LTPAALAYQIQEGERQDMDLSWEPTVDYVGFITHVSTVVQLHLKAVAEAAATDQTKQSLRFVLDNLFWKKFCALREDEAGKVLDVLKTAPITKILFHHLQLSNHASNLTATEACAAFHRLCDALGAIRTITSAGLSVMDDVLSGQYGYAIRALTSITKAHINVYYSDAVVNRSIASALVHHPALCTLFLLYTAASVLQTYVTVLSTMPKLKKVTLHRQLSPPSQFLSFNETEALVEVLRIDRPLSIKLWLDGKLTDPATHRRFCAGIAEARVQGVHLHCCEMIDAVSFARALTSSSLKTFRYSTLTFVELDDSTAFLSTLAAGLPSMRNLEDLDVELIAFVFVGNLPVLDCECIVRAAASCPRLKRLVLSLLSYTATMDAALAYCLQTRTSLEDMTIDCPKTATHEPVHDCCLLVEAVKKSYTIQHLRLVPTIGSNPLESWNSDMKANISMICRLNRSGRAYMEADSNNQREGLEVLGAVSEDVNCLYFHLRENPLLCGAQ